MAPVVATGWHHCSKKKLTTFLDSCMSSLRLSMLFFSVSFKRETPRIMFVILTQWPFSPLLVQTWRSSYADTVGEGVKKTGKSSGQCTVEIPVQSTAREFHTSLPCRRTSPLVNNFQNPAVHSSKLHTQKKERRVISGAMLLKKKKTHDMCSFCTCPSVDPSIVHVIASHFAPGPCQSLYRSNLTSSNTRLREHPQPTSRMPHCVACHPCK